MKITETTLKEGALGEFDNREYFAIKVNGKTFVDFMDGEPEDATISRDFVGVFRITHLMQIAYDAGKNGEEIVFEDEELDEL